MLLQQSRMFLLVRSFLVRKIRNIDNPCLWRVCQQQLRMHFLVCSSLVLVHGPCKRRVLLEQQCVALLVGTLSAGKSTAACNFGHVHIQWLCLGQVGLSMSLQLGTNSFIDCLWNAFAGCGAWEC